MWRDILLANAAAVDTALAGFGAQLGRLREAIRRGDEAELVRLLEHAATQRRTWGGKTLATTQSRFIRSTGRRMRW